MTLRENADPSIRRHDEGLFIDLGYSQLRVLLRGADTGGAFAVTKQPLASRALAGPLHAHGHETGVIHVLEGRIGAQVAERTLEVGPGDSVIVDKGVQHTFWNPGDVRAAVLEFFAPAGLEAWFEELAQLVAAAPADIDAIVDSARRYGTELDLDSLPQLLEKHGLRLPGL